MYKLNAFGGIILILLFILLVLVLLLVVRGGAPRYRIDQLVGYTTSVLTVSVIVLLLALIVLSFVL